MVLFVIPHQQRYFFFPHKKAARTTHEQWLLSNDLGQRWSKIQL